MPKITLEALQAHLWRSADILRGHIDAADYKNYIFGLLFLKRLSDVFEEESEQIERQTGNRKLAREDGDYHRFMVPDKARWETIRSKTQNLGEVLDKANEALEEENPETLQSILTPTTFNDKDRLPDSLLSALIAHFSSLRLRNADLEKPDILGDAYEYLIGQFASSAGKKGGEFYTPKEVVELLVDLLDPRAGMRICDPACGSGGMLIQSVVHLKEKGQNPRDISLFGQEINVSTWAICKMNLLLHGLPDHQVKRCDTLRNPQLVRDGRLMQFDIVIANPPFSLKNWGYETAQNDPFKRFHYGIPPKGYADFAFVQHMIAIMNPGGKAGIVLPHGILFRGGAEGKIRKGILEDDLVEAVIGLPSKLFYGAGIPACLLILNRRKPKERRGRVFFLYGARDYLDGKKQNKLRKEDILKIVSACEDFRSIGKYCRTVSINEIRQNDWNLNITRYIDVSEGEEEIDVQKTLDGLRELKAQYQSLEEKVMKHLRELDYRV